MVTNLQFAAVAAYLLWCLLASLSDVLDRDQFSTEPSIHDGEQNKPVK